MENVIKFPLKVAPGEFKRARLRRKHNPNQLSFLFALSVRPDGSFDEGREAQDRGEREEAARLYRRVIEGGGDGVADAYCNLGILEFEAGRPAKAVDCFARSLGSDPRHLCSHNNLGNLYFEREDYRLAELHYEISVELHPADPDVYYYLGISYAKNGKYARAIETLREFQGLSPGEARKADTLLCSLRHARRGTKK